MFGVILQEIVTDNNGERVMSGNEEVIYFNDKEVAVKCFNYFHRMGSSHVPWVTFNDAWVQHAPIGAY